MEPRGRERHRWAKPRGRNGREHMSQCGQRASFKRSDIGLRRENSNSKFLDGKQFSYTLRER